MNEITIKKAVELVGIGLHKGNPVKLRLEPLESGRGIEFYRIDTGVTIPLKKEFVVDTQMATVIGKGSSTISTIEHLLSAVYAYGIDNLRIMVDDNEIPVMDGSSASFCMLLDEAGLTKQKSAKKIIRIKKEVRVQEGDKYVQLKPSDELNFDFTIHFKHPVINKQSLNLKMNKETYKSEISRARTFGFIHELQYLQSKNLALGASLENAIGLDDKKVLNAEGLRFTDEFVRHKILDAIGDMALIGHNFLGSYEAFAGSHDLNHKLTVKLFESPENYEVIEPSISYEKETTKAYA